MRLYHNLAALNIYRSYSNNLSNLSKASDMISSGLRINSSKDDPYGLAQSERMDMQVKGLAVAQRNAQDGVSMIQTVNGGLNNISSDLQNIRKLVVKAQNESNSPDDENAIQMQISSLLDGIDDIANDTEFNGVKMISGSDDGKPLKPLQALVGVDSGDTVKIPTYNFTSSNLGTKDADGNIISSLRNINVVNQNKDSDALNIIDASINDILSASDKYGAIENRFSSTIDNIEEVSENTESSYSKISDVDVSSEMVEYSKDSILTEAGNAMMAQANKFPQEILSILQNIK